MLTYEFINSAKNSSELVLNWEKKQFPVKIEFAVDDIVMANATEELKGPTGFNWQGYTSAANYALQNKTDYEQALKWIDQAIAQNNAFATLSVKSNILKATGKTADADTIMSQAIAIATENELNLYGYTLMNGGQHDKAIEMFILNTKRFPKSANTFDSLGEAYATKIAEHEPSCCRQGKFRKVFERTGCNVACVNDILKAESYQGHLRMVFYMKSCASHKPDKKTHKDEKSAGCSFFDSVSV
jgi:tetratricopeptide (TPR) repeat protein